MGVRERLPQGGTRVSHHIKGEKPATKKTAAKPTTKKK
jgi:hypothetical protein